MGNGGLGFWPRAAPPPARGGPCSCSVPPAARAARPPGARPAAPPSRFGAIAPSALFGPINGAKRKRNARPLQSSGLPPATPRRASAAGGLVVAGAGGVRPGPSRAAVVCVGRLRPRPSLGGGRPPPRWSATRGRACGAGPPSRPVAGLGAFRPWSSLAWSRAAASPSLLHRPGAAKGGGHVGPPPSEANAARGAGGWIPPPAGGGERPGA